MEAKALQNKEIFKDFLSFLSSNTFQGPLMQAVFSL